jgi:hypothetical protein
LGHAALAHNPTRFDAEIGGGSLAARGSEVRVMQFDLGLYGLGILVALSLGFGVVAQVVVQKAGTRWMWLIAAAGWFIGGLYASEVLFATATVDEIQPIIDGLALDESLLGGLMAGVVAVLVSWYLARGNQSRRPTSI